MPSNVNFTLTGDFDLARGTFGLLDGRRLLKSDWMASVDAASPLISFGLISFNFWFFSFLLSFFCCFLCCFNRFFSSRFVCLMSFFVGFLDAPVIDDFISASLSFPSLLDAGWTTPLVVAGWGACDGGCRTLRSAPLISATVETVADELRLLCNCGRDALANSFSGWTNFSCKCFDVMSGFCNGINCSFWMSSFCKEITAIFQRHETNANKLWYITLASLQFPNRRNEFSKK